MPPQATLLSPAERLKRRDQKRQVLLRFLRQELWSTSDILQEVFGLTSRQAAYKTLKQFSEEQLIRKHTVDALGGPITIWGITPHGQALAFDLKHEEPIRQYFEPSKISELTIRHELDVQRIRLKAEASGWQDWQNGHRLGEIPKDAQRPDALVRDPQGRLIAIECERTLKTLKRYEIILSHYLQAIKKGVVHQVAWVCPTDELAIRLRKMVTGIKTVRVHGQSVAIDPAKHHAPLSFLSLATFPNNG